MVVQRSFQAGKISEVNYNRLHSILNRSFHDRNLVWEAINECWLRINKTAHVGSQIKYILKAGKFRCLLELKRRKKYISVSVGDHIIENIPSRYCQIEEYIESVTSEVPEPYKTPLIFIIRHFINKGEHSQSIFMTPETLRYTLRDAGKFKRTREYAKWIYEYLSELFKDDIVAHNLHTKHIQSHQR
jgi:hypothetical protein